MHENATLRESIRLGTPGKSWSQNTGSRGCGSGDPRTRGPGVADLGVLEAAVQRGDPSLELHGLWRYCVGEGADQITIQPPIKELPHHAGQSIEIKDTAPRVFLVIGPNLHQYAHIYGSLRHGVMDFMEPSSRLSGALLSSPGSSLGDLGPVVPRFDLRQKTLILFYQQK